MTVDVVDGYPILCSARGDGGDKEKSGGGVDVVFNRLIDGESDGEKQTQHALVRVEEIEIVER